MYTLYTDKSEDFKCNIGVEGVSLNDTKARLVLESSKLNLMFTGDIKSDGTCSIPISKLKGIFNEGDVGKLKLEVIADDVLFSPWESDFSIKTQRKVQVEVQQNDDTVIKENKKIHVKVESTPATVKEIQVVTKPLSSPSLTKESKDTTVIKTMFDRRGINKSNLRENKDIINNIIDTYIRKYNITESKENLFKRVLTKME
jgi:hypothetical protein